MSKVIRAKFEKGVLKPLEEVELREGEEVRIIILPREFTKLVRESNIEAKRDVEKVLQEGRERWVRWYSTRA
ncbi:MAG: DUF104 domain-containing protein [archaeon GB-1867-005]|nr:DUF104 domain-containing protein [Candidatus Culexmicrobium cathedralense]